jgi:hypothetical protein
MSAALTNDAPRWLVLLLLGLVAAAYLACGLLSLIGRVRRMSASRPRGLRPIQTRRGAGVRQGVAS